MTHYFTKEEEIEDNAKEQIALLAENPFSENIAIFPDIHYCSEKGIPVGLVFASKTHVMPLITGSDMGCGVAYLKFQKTYITKEFDKAKHYSYIYNESLKYTDAGLGGGNHFLSVEEDELFWYIFCHTGTRDMGIYMKQKNYKLLNDYGDGNSIEVETLLGVEPNWFVEYQNVIDYGKKRRREFCYKLFFTLITTGYVEDKLDAAYNPKQLATIKTDLSKILSCIGKYKLEYGDSVHNHIKAETDLYGNRIYVHRKGATELNNDIVVIPLSMSRGSLLVKSNRTGIDNINSCSHGAGRKLARTDALKYWYGALNNKERQAYRDKFSEMLDNSGEFPTRYIQELDFAYKSSTDILTDQPFLKKVTETTPIFTIKVSDI